MRTDRDRLLDILKAIARIERYTHGDRSSLEDELVQTSVVHTLEIVGEAARGVSVALRERYPDLPWRGMIGTRDVLAHGYFAVDVDRVWDTVAGDLPKLKRQVEAVLEEMARSG